MLCLTCNAFCFSLLCKNCREQFLKIKLKIRIVEDLKIYSFYDYQDISLLLNTKYYAIGSRVFSLLAKKANAHFLTTHQEFFKQYIVHGVGIDDNPKKGYSHTGVILHAFRNIITPIYGELQAKNKVKYAGKSLEFRQKNPRGLVYKSGSKDLVIFDDIVTTGLSMLEAKKAIEKGGGNVLFGVVLSDAKG